MSQKKTHFWLPELYDLSLPPTCIIWSFCCGGLTYEWSSRHGDPHSSWFQALPNTEAVSHWLVGPGHKVAGCRYLGVPRASTGSLVDRARFWGVSSKADVPRYFWPLTAKTTASHSSHLRCRRWTQSFLAPWP